MRVLTTALWMGIGLVLLTVSQTNDPASSRRTAQSDLPFAMQKQALEPEFWSLQPLAHGPLYWNRPTWFEENFALPTPDEIWTERRSIRVIERADDDTFPPADRPSPDDLFRPEQKALLTSAPKPQVRMSHGPTESRSSELIPRDERAHLPIELAA